MDTAIKHFSANVSIDDYPQLSKKEKAELMKYADSQGKIQVNGVMEIRDPLDSTKSFELLKDQDSTPLLAPITKKPFINWLKLYK
jgi:hypothetical protein